MPLGQLLVVAAAQVLWEVMGHRLEQVEMGVMELPHLLAVHPRPMLAAAVVVEIKVSQVAIAQAEQEAAVMVVGICQIMLAHRGPQG